MENQEVPITMRFYILLEDMNQKEGRKLQDIEDII
jgi:hypothetical protein